MPGNAFITFRTNPEGQFTPGESMQTGHEGSKGWIEIGEWNWEVTADTSFLKGTGAAVGKPSPGVLTFTHYYDKSSPILMQYIVKGMHFKSAKIHCLKATGADKPEVFFEMIMKDVFITKVGNKGNEDGSVNQEVGMVFKEVALGYKQQLNTGKLDKTPKTFNWNIAEMTNAVHGDLKLTI